MFGRGGVPSLLAPTRMRLALHCRLACAPIALCPELQWGNMRALNCGLHLVVVLGRAAGLWLITPVAARRAIESAHAAASTTPRLWGASV